MNIPRPQPEVLLLKGGHSLFSAMVRAIDAAQTQVRVETYIFHFSGQPLEVAQALVRAAERGVAVSVVVDGVGTPQLPLQWDRQFAAAGVQYRIFAPVARAGLWAPVRWRRLHRKLCVVDGEVAFCGGINLLDDFVDLSSHQTLPQPRLDFAVQLHGAWVAAVDRAMTQLWWRMQAVSDLRDQRFAAAVGALRESTQTHSRQSRGRYRLIMRDNLRHRNHIERHYIKALGRARRDVYLANAYFYPGARLQQALVDASRRGVRVHLLVQGRYEYWVAYRASHHLYGPLLAAGIEIYEYHASYLHAKVAVVDGLWTTVGSSNLDPLSLLLAREANIVARDEFLAEQLQAGLINAIQKGAHRIDPAQFVSRSWLERCVDATASALFRLAILINGKRY